MRATRAYIASLGTAGVLVASSALLLVVVSALVAFNAWPGGDAASGLKGLVVNDDQSSLELTGPARVAADAAPAAAVVSAGPPAGAGAGSGGAGNVLSTPVAPGGGGPGSGPAQPRSAAPGSPTSVLPGGPVKGPPAAPAPDVQGVTKGAGGTVEQVTGDAGKGLGQVNAPVANGVTDTGKALSEIVQGLGPTAKQLGAP